MIEVGAVTYHLPQGVYARVGAPTCQQVRPQIPQGNDGVAHYLLDGSLIFLALPTGKVAAIILNRKFNRSFAHKRTGQALAFFGNDATLNQCFSDLHRIGRGPFA